ncbi:MAG: hypothetical protein HQK97_01860 [Nitrospirae bacterium]|nr:hypothetical protein [Nitrospirota bacterium]
MARRLQTMSDVRRYLANLINEADADKVSIEKATKLSYMANILKGIIQSGDFEERLAALEAQLNKAGGK